MEFTVHTYYDQKTATAMTRALRKTERKKRNRRSRIIGVLIMLFGFFMAFVGEEGFGPPASARQWLDLAVAVVLLAILLFEDQVNGYFARKRMLPDTRDVMTTFEKEQFVSVTPVASSSFTYDKVIGLVDVEGYIVFTFSKNHAQAYDKNGITGGTPEEFAAFLEETTGKKIIKI